MRHVAFFLVASFYLATFGCSRQEESSDVSVSRPTADGRIVVEKAISVLDNEVLAAVLDDILTYRGEDSPVAVQGSPPTEILFEPKPVQYPQTIDEVLFRHQQELWTKLTPTQTSASREAADHLVKRIQNRDFFVAFKPQDKRVRIHEEREAQTAEESVRSRFDRPIEAWPPGYSKNKRFAVVRLIVPWSIHHAEGTYVLSEDHGKWTVRLRQFVYYV